MIDQKPGSTRVQGAHQDQSSQQVGELHSIEDQDMEIPLLKKQQKHRDRVDRKHGNILPQKDGTPGAHTPAPENSKALDGIDHHKDKNEVS